MAKQIGHAGESVRKMENERFKKRLKVKIILLISVWIILFFMLWFLPQIAGKAMANGATVKFPLSFPQALGLSFLFTLLIGIKVIGEVFFKRVDRKGSSLKKRQYQAAKGAAAEEAVGEILKELPDDFIILHDVPSPYGNIDHIAVSKNHGVFVIETKSHNGRVTTNGKKLFRDGQNFEKNIVSQVLKNTFWLRDEIKRKTGISTFVTPVLIFTNAFVAVRQPVKGISVVNKKYLLETILRGRNRVGRKVVECLTSFGKRNKQC